MRIVAFIILAICVAIFPAVRVIAGEPERKAPKAVVQLANECIDSLPTVNGLTRAAAIDEYLEYFFHGFLNPEGGGGINWSLLDESATKAGGKYRREHPKKLKETLEGFGYKAIQSVGVWHRGNETSAFVPRNQPEERWWLSWLNDDESEVPTEFDSEKGATIRVTGFLSPKGRYGHAGGL